MSRTCVRSCLLFLVATQLVWARNPCKYQGDAVKCPTKSKFLCLLLKRNLQPCVSDNACPCATRCCDLGCGNYCWPSGRGRWQPMAGVDSNVLSQHRKKRSTLTLHQEDPLAMALSNYPPHSVVNRYNLGEDTVLIEKPGAEKHPYIAIPPGYPANLPNRFDNYPTVFSPQTKNIPPPLSEIMIAGTNKTVKVVRPEFYPKVNDQIEAVPKFYKSPKLPDNQARVQPRSASSKNSLLPEPDTQVTDKWVLLPSPRPEEVSKNPAESGNIKHLFPHDGIKDKTAEKTQFLKNILKRFGVSRLAKWKPKDAASDKPQIISDKKEPIGTKHLFPMGDGKSNTVKSVDLLIKTLKALRLKKNIPARLDRKEILSKILGPKQTHVKLNFHLRVKNDSDAHYRQTYPSPVAVNGNVYDFMGRKGARLPYSWSIEYKPHNTSASENAKPKKKTKEAAIIPQTSVSDTDEITEETEDEFDVFIWYLKDNKTTDEAHRSSSKMNVNQEERVKDDIRESKQPLMQKEIPSSVEYNKRDESAPHYDIFQRRQGALQEKGIPPQGGTSEGSKQLLVQNDPRDQGQQTLTQKGIIPHEESREKSLRHHDETHPIAVAHEVDNKQDAKLERIHQQNSGHPLQVNKPSGSNYNYPDHREKLPQQSSQYPSHNDFSTSNIGDKQQRINTLEAQKP